MLRRPGTEPLTLPLPARPLVLAAAALVLLACAGPARAGYITADSLASAGADRIDPSITAADTDLLGGMPVAPDAPNLDENHPNPGSPDRPCPSGMVGGCGRTLAGLLRAPGGSRSPRASSSRGSGPLGGLCRAATGLPDTQLVMTVRAAAALTDYPAPVHSIFKPPRASV